MLQKPTRWTAAPALAEARARDLWKGLAFLAPLWGGAGKGALLGAHGGPLDGASLTDGSTLQWRGTPYGMGAGLSGASNLLYQDNFEPVTTSDGAGTGDFTLLCLANPIAEAAASVGLSQQAGPNTRTHLGFNCSTATSGLGVASGSLVFIARDGTTGGLALGGVIDGQYHLFACRRAGTNHSIWIDGVPRASASNTARDIANGAGGFAIGNLAESSSNRINTATTIVLAAGWNRALSDAEMRMLARDPFCMFRPQAEWRGVWTPLGGDVTLGPADLTDGFGFATAAFSQDHSLTAADAFLAAAFETPALQVSGALSPEKSFLAVNFEAAGFSQAHTLSAQKINSAFMFDAALLSMGAQTTPLFRTSDIASAPRRKEISTHGRDATIAASNRTNLITE